MERLEETRRRYEERAAQAEEHVRRSREMEEETTRLLEDLRQKRRRRWAEELEEARAFVRNLRGRGGELLAAIERGAADRRDLRRFLKEEDAGIVEQAASFEEPPTSDATPPTVGDQVAVGERGIRGELLAVEGDRAWIRRGTMRFEVPAAQVRRIGEALPQTVQVRVQPPPEDTPHEISLIGLRAREAIERLEAFLDHTARAGYPSVRIIHGIGSGALKRAVAEHLSGSPYCAAFHMAEPEQGGSGVTIAELANV
jgi:DNA mismatch repair protein MutS2